MANSSDLRVHLDHLLIRESLRWVEPKLDKDGRSQPFRSPLTKLRYQDLDDRERNTIFPLLRKPDFQRETSAWTPEDCVSLLESIISGLIIPSLIVWKSPENNYLYVLDGAHRLSVMRAWILDDWGDKATEDYYERHEFGKEIRNAAQNTRELVKAKFGSYDDFTKAGTRYLELTREGSSPKDVLTQLEFKRGLFYTEILQDAGFHIQEVSGDYKVAEASFLKINRSGQPLDDWETTLIENRNSSFARAVMSIANGGSGRFWPEQTDDISLKQKIEDIKHWSQILHKWIFIPPFTAPIRDVNVPFIATVKYFPKHAYLLELLPVVKQISNIDSLFQLDNESDVDIIIRNGHNLISLAHTAMRHLTGPSDDPLSMAIVPLFYFYTQGGRYVRSSLYGFIAWLNSGSSQDILKRKVIFSAHRGRFERVVFGHDMPGAITRRVGSGLRATQANVQFYQKLVELLIKDSSDVDSEEFQTKLESVLKKLTAPRLNASKSKDGRKFDDNQKTTINLRELFKSSIRCEICGGILDLRLGVQYDHITRYSDSRITTSDDGRPTHPFCNNQRDQIEKYQKKLQKIALPSLIESPFGSNDGAYQPSLFSLFDKTSFPDES